jgi:RNA polymerase sigma-70 factor (ECF subfamily)
MNPLGAGGVQGTMEGALAESGWWLTCNPWRVVGSSLADDAPLVERAREGDRIAFEELVRRYADRLYAVVLRFLGDRQEAEEVTQEAFLRAWRGIAGFHGRSEFFTWLYRIGINEAKRRAERGAPTEPSVSLDEQPSAAPTDRRDEPHRRAEQRDLRHALEQAVRALPPKYRAALILRDIEGLSTREAADIMELHESAFKSRLHRARLAVREAIEDHLGEEHT